MNSVLVWELTPYRNGCSSAAATSSAANPAQARMGKRVCCMTAFMRGRGGSSGHGCFRMSRAIFSGSASPHAHCLRPRRARRDAAAAAAQCALQCMLAGTQRRRLTEWVLSVPNVRGPSTGRVGRLSACQARAALAHTPSIFRWSFFFYYSYTSLPPFPTVRRVVASSARRGARRSSRRARLPEAIHA